jgi:DNA polymerase-3 subunit epsilon
MEGKFKTNITPLIPPSESRCSVTQLDQLFAKATMIAALGGLMNFVAIDFETANHGRDSACSVGLVKVIGGLIVDRVVHLIRPPTRQFMFSYIHGITWNDVAKSPDFGMLWPRLKPLLQGAEFLAAHNASFDKSVLNACCAKHGISAPTLSFQCSMEIARRTWNIFPTKLSDVCHKLRIELNHHEALSDATACAKIVLAANKVLAAKPTIRRRSAESTYP